MYNVGDKFGHLEIKELVVSREKFRRPRTEAICICHKCGKSDYAILPYNLKKQKSCGCDRTWASPPSGQESKLFKGYKEMSNKYLYKAKRRAEEKDLPFDITQEFLWELFEQQGRKCKLSGLPLDFGINTRANGATASLDRVNSRKGYTRDNVQWLHRDINLMKNVFETEYFVQLCGEVVKTQDPTETINV